jgi:hypothetical protein
VISRQDQNRPSAGTRGRRSRGVGDRGIGVFEERELVHLETVIRKISRSSHKCGPLAPEKRTGVGRSTLAGSQRQVASAYRGFVSWSCKGLRQEVRYREKRYPDNHRVACGTTRASGR